jgi:hypothetical protein
MTSAIKYTIDGFELGRDNSSDVSIQKQNIHMVFSLAHQQDSYWTQYIRASICLMNGKHKSVTLLRLDEEIQFEYLLTK